jgi:hypothetical protein
MCNATKPNFDPGTPEVTQDLYLEIDTPEHGESLRMTVHVKELAAAGVILEVVDPPPGLKDESLLQREVVLHMVPEGFTKETQLRSKVVWIRQGELGPSHYLLGLDLREDEFRARRSLDNSRARPKDISDLWMYWDQVQTIQAATNKKTIFYLGIAVFLCGLVLKVVLPDSHNILAIALMLSGFCLISGKSLWNWWRKRSIPEKNWKLWGSGLKRPFKKSTVLNRIKRRSHCC